VPGVDGLGLIADLEVMPCVSFPAKRLMGFKTHSLGFQGDPIKAVAT
jgi:hypothetical protein